jgi:ribosomal protein S18 acetylase RimI-like enzyme
MRGFSHAGTLSESQGGEVSEAIRIRPVDKASDRDIEGLAEVLVDCVEGGASVSFMLPMTRAKAVSFWRNVAKAVARGERLLFVAEDDQGVVGTVQVILDLPENQPHRGDVAKMLVHRRARRRGVGERLLQAAEDGARAMNRRILVLDTASDSAARLYTRAGWKVVGVIPEYALLPGGDPCATTYFYKDLSSTSS